YLYCSGGVALGLSRSRNARQMGILWHNSFCGFSRTWPSVSLTLCITSSKLETSFQGRTSPRLLWHSVPGLGAAALVAGSDPFRGHRWRLSDTEHRLDERGARFAPFARRWSVEFERHPEYAFSATGIHDPFSRLFPSEGPPAENFRRIP